MMKGKNTMPNNVATFAYTEQKSGITAPAFAASGGVQAASVDTQSLNDLLQIAAFRAKSNGYPDGTGFRMYYNPTSKDVYLCKTGADGAPLTENGSVTLYDVFKDDVTLDYSMTYKIACNYNQFQIQKAQGEMVGDGDQNYFKLDDLFTTDGHPDYDLLNAFEAAGSAEAETLDTTESAAETTESTSETEEESTTAAEAETEADTEAETEETAASETEEETELQTTVAVPEPEPQTPASGGTSGLLIAVVIFLAILLTGVMVTCFLLVKKIRESQDATAPDTSKYDKREKEYQEEIVRLAKENERLKDELDNKN